MSIDEEGIEMAKNIFEGDFVRLREYHKEDIPIAWKYVNDWEVKKYLIPGTPFPWKFEEEEKWYEELSAKREDNYSFAIERKSDNQYIGGCGINDLDWKNSVATVGIFLGKNFLSQGYGTDAMNVLVDFIFSEMNIHKVMLYVYAFNERAVKSYQKVGFKIEGTLRSQIFREGKYHDEIVMGILKEERWVNL